MAYYSSRPFLLFQHRVKSTTSSSTHVFWQRWWCWWAPHPRGAARQTWRSHNPSYPATISQRGSRSATTHNESMNNGRQADVRPRQWMLLKACNQDVHSNTTMRSENVWEKSRPEQGVKKVKDSNHFEWRIRYFSSYFDSAYFFKWSSSERHVQSRLQSHSNLHHVCVLNLLRNKSGLTFEH